MPRPPAPVHYLRPNDKVWTPAHVLYLDTETRVIPRSEPEILALRLWCARFVDRRPTRSNKQVTVNSYGYTPEQLVEFIEQQFIGRQTIWLFAHNLSFDLVTTRLPLILVSIGWTITDAAVGGSAPWMRLGKGSNRLTLVDSGSWLPQDLASVGSAIGLNKPELPAEAASSDVWLERCNADVDILATAMEQIMGWWDERELGRFTITGAACGWNAFRHLPSLSRIVVDPTPALIDADRRAVHGGRRGVWRVGDIKGGVLLELDLTSAYPRVAADLPLPMRRSIGFQTLPIDDYRVTSDRWSILAEVELDTTEPRWPMRWNKATWYPTGQFKADLAGPEIAEAARLGALRAIGPGHVHQLGHAMLNWARWVLDNQRPDNDQVPPAAKLVSKHWGRAVIGKWASRTYERTELGPSPVAGWGYEEVWSNAAQSRGGLVDIAGRRWFVAPAAESDNAYPAVLAWVESHVRLRLSRVLAALGPGVVIQCDTDGLIVTEDGLIRWCAAHHHPGQDDRSREGYLRRALAELNELTSPLVLRVKRQYNSVRVLGPQHVETPTERRFSGLPKHATRTGEDKYAYRAWPKMQWQMGNGDERGYARPLVEPTIAGPFANGWVLSTGRVVPPRAVIDADGQSQIVGWEFMPPSIRRQTLAPKQHPALQALLDATR